MVTSGRVLSVKRGTSAPSIASVNGVHGAAATHRVGTLPPHASSLFRTRLPMQA